MSQLPPLPEPDSYCTHADLHEYDVFTADQMRAYAEAAIASMKTKDEQSVATVTDEEIINALNEIDLVCREWDVYEYGIPMYENEPQEKIVAIIRALLSSASQPKVPDCGACPGDGSICPSTCKVEEDSPPIASQPAQSVDEREEPSEFLDRYEADCLRQLQNEPRERGMQSWYSSQMGVIGQMREFLREHPVAALKGGNHG